MWRLATNTGTMRTVSLAATNTRAARRRAPVRWPWLLVAVAWAVALLATATHARFLIDHQWLIERSRLPWLLAALIFLACWQVMTVAMMLPSSMPLLYVLTYAARKKRGPHTTLALFLAGYAAVWTAFAGAAFVGDTGIHQLVNAWPWLAEHWYVIGMTTLALAGLYQFSPLKERCLTACRSPLDFFTRYYREGVGPAWRLGLRHGFCCVGCCWTLMLVMFGVGVGSLVWMAGLTGVMVVEKAVPGGKRFTPFAGIALLLLAILWFVQPAWLGAAGV
jgi:predicted metal-binding membrane protein